MFRERTRKQQTGDRAEQAARRYLEAQGLRHVTSNFRCRYGEIDLIMRDADSLVFVEVRARRHRNWGTAAESVDARKQQKLIRSAQAWLQRHPHKGPCRFDVVTCQAGELEWLRDAFCVTD